MQQITGFYKGDNTALQFDPCKEADLIYIRFNQYILRKENLQRLSGDLPRGQFKLSTKTVSDDLNIPNAKAQRTIKKFIELGIIKPISISKTKNVPSIYSYIVAGDIQNQTSSDMDSDMDSDMQERGKTDSLKGIGDMDSDMQSDNSKKESLKTITKNKNIFDRKGDLLLLIENKLKMKLSDKDINDINFDNINKDLVLMVATNNSIQNKLGYLIQCSRNEKPFTPTKPKVIRKELVPSWLNAEEEQQQQQQLSKEDIIKLKKSSDILSQYGVSSPIYKQLNAFGETDLTF